ncbi:hypothetical protein [uncultured Erythrobacter sp.]|uniref:hypothetical protein n=1 Tax=uncultured Erythrobacter sp. TaxID=263913 RepID=UPI002629A86D|nr:hypothetical protein [uncultured Erythrobacter sp.]
MRRFLIISRVIVCLLIFLVGLMFAGYSSELVKVTLTDLDRFILVAGFIVGLGSTLRWIHDLEFWAPPETTGEE